MDYTDLVSDRISRVGYDPATREMRVQFLRGGEYSYPNVPVHQVRMLTTAYSPGQTFDALFRDRTDHTRTEDEDDHARG